VTVEGDSTTTVEMAQKSVKGSDLIDEHPNWFAYINPEVHYITLEDPSKLNIIGREDWSAWKYLTLSLTYCNEGTD
jgi:hypothetical protein